MLSLLNILVLILIVITTFVENATCSTDGLTYMDALNLRILPRKPPRGEDPCNPLYWYPRQIPEYCYKKTLPNPIPIPVPLPPQPMPIPSPIPNSFSSPHNPKPVPISYPTLINPECPIFVDPIPMSFPIPSSLPRALPVPAPSLTSVLYGALLAPANPMLPVPGMPLPFVPAPPQIGLVPGIPGIVSRDGGINVLPFSDVYSDLLEKNKQKYIRKRLQKLLDDYNRRSSRYRRNRHYY